MENEQSQTNQEQSRQTSWSSWINKNGAKIIVRSGLVSIALALAGLGIKSCEKHTFTLPNATYSGIHYEKADGSELVYFNDNATPMQNRDIHFNGMKENVGDSFNVSGYRTFWGNYATNITPVNARAPLTQNQPRANPHYGQTNANGTIDSKVLLPPEPYFD